MINVVIADNQELVREGVIAILSGAADIHIVGSAANATELDELIKAHKPQVIIVADDFSHDLDYTDTGILILSNNQNKEPLLQLLDQGIKNYVFKQCSREEVINAVYATAKGEPFFCAKVLHAIKENAAAGIPKEEPNLTYREIEIARLIAKGMTNQAIADKLFLSVHTIKTHRKNIIKKLGFTFKHASELVVALSYLNDMFI